MGGCAGNTYQRRTWSRGKGVCEQKQKFLEDLKGVKGEVLKGEEGCRVGKRRERGFQASSERSCSEYADILSSLPSPTSFSGRAAHTSISSTPTASQIGHTGSDLNVLCPLFSTFVH